MQFQPQPSLNGHHTSGKDDLNENKSTKNVVSGTTANRNATVFLNDLPISDWQSFLHHLSVAQMAGTPLLRLLTLLLLGFSVLAFLGVLPGGMIAGTLLFLLLVAFHAHIFTQRRTDFVRFEVANSEQPIPNMLRVEEKVAVYVTGECSVEGKRRRFTCLPGFYRTFATREHALLCQVKDRRIFGIASWNKAEVGLWYVFFRPESIRKIESGILRYGNHSLPTLAIQHEAITKVNKLGEPERTERQTVYVSVVDPMNLDAIFADLSVDAPKQVPA